ncbi:putative glycosyltransferase EpsD [Pseudobythopirellula maris]|uniref:Putative glycosyltransferase EpsD n=2 Tax=Pseudobythopirellula maris TaxID=2527991 RepID=A0A5C5ZQF2_9BACT|nr:putative glycosyltransferase EpsD [Pseudobythopirellula maris]
MVIHARGITGAGGGPEKTIANSPRFLEAAGYDCLCAYMHPPGDPGFEAFLDRADKAGARVDGVPDRGAFDLSVVRAYSKICDETNAAIWHAHDYKTDVLGLLLRRGHRRRMKLITTVHGWVEATRKTAVYYAIDRRVLRFYDHVIAVSDDLYEECLRYGVRENRLSLVRNAIDEQQFTRTRTAEQARTLLGLPAGAPLIGGAGRLSPEKAFDTLIHAAARIEGLAAPVHVAIAGEGEEHGRLLALAERLGMGGRVHLLGRLQDVTPFFESLDAFVLSSLREGLPNVVLEAMALGAPVVSTRVAGVPKLIDDDRHGLLVDIGDTDGLAQAIGALLTDKPRSDRLREAARRRIESDFSFSKRMDSVIAIYDRLLGAPREGDAS